MVICDLVVQSEEIIDMPFRSVFGIFDHGACFDNEGPIAGLREQDFTGSLIYARRRRGEGGRIIIGQVDHAVCDFMQMRVNPVVGFIKPNFTISIGAPSRKRRLSHLEVWKSLEVFARCQALYGNLTRIHASGKDN